jgi:SAM-dependent methyltransferase
VEGRNYSFDKSQEPGNQFIREATELSGIPSGRYDFVLSSHTLEHVANPLKALREWIRVLREEGTLVLIVPHKDGTFDHKRPVTDLDHLLDDYENNTAEDDLTHLPEILQLHDLQRNPEAGSRAEFETRCKENFKHRCLHHHVFDTQHVAELVSHEALQINAVEVLRPFHIVVLAQKMPSGHRANNKLFTSGAAKYLGKSPFPSDKRASKRAET